MIDPRETAGAAGAGPALPFHHPFLEPNCPDRVSFLHSGPHGRQGSRYPAVVPRRGRQEPDGDYVGGRVSANQFSVGSVGRASKSRSLVSSVKPMWRHNAASSMSIWERARPRRRRSLKISP